MKIGFSICDLTPEPGIYLTGYGQPERLADSIHSPLHGVVMALEDNGTEAVVIGLDWCFVDWKLTCEIRKGINAETGVPESNIILSCSHTHSAPHTTYARTMGRSAVDPENKGIKYTFDCIPKLAAAVKNAKNNLRECKAGFAAAKTQTGISRRGTDENGKVTGFIGDPNQIYDDNMTVVYFRDAATDQDLGIFVHASAHNTAMGGSRAISSDWCGIMKKRIANKYNVPVIFINGAIGDVGPRTNLWCKYNTQCGFSAGGGDGITSAEEVGYRAAGDALRALEGIRDFRTELPMKVHVGELRLPQALSMTKEETEKIIDSFKDAGTNTAEPDTTYQIAKIVHDAWMQPPEPEYVLEQTIISFGPVAIVPFPFEMFSIFSLRLRKFGPFEYNLLTSNTNGRNAYLPDRGSFAMGGYEPECLKSIRPYVIKPDAGDIAIKQSLAALREM